MRVKLVACALAGVFALAGPAAAIAGNNGYEGQPGNQSSGGGNNGNNGNNGYEGQPGNQSNG
jgi:hypothetical protein